MIAYVDFPRATNACAIFNSVTVRSSQLVGLAIGVINCALPIRSTRIPLGTCLITFYGATVCGHLMFPPIKER